jgi:hypothetical protein
VPVCATLPLWPRRGNFGRNLRASANALVAVEAQLHLMPDEPPPREEDRRLASSSEANVERIAPMLRSGIHDNQILRKAAPDRAAHQEHN